MVGRPRNPYIAGAPLQKEQGFFGRHDILDWVKRELRNPATNALVLFGQRRIGKTSLLHKLVRVLPTDAFLPVYFSLEDQSARPMGQVLADLADAVTKQVGIEFTDRDAFDDQGRFFRQEFLPSLYKALGDDLRPVFLLDEFDTLDWETEKELPETAAAKALFPFLHEVMNEDLRSVFVFVVGRRAEDLALDFTATFKASLVREIWVLDQESAEALVRQAETNGSLHFTKQAVERTLNFTCCHPYLTQLLCQRIWERSRTRNSATQQVDVPDVESAVPDVLETGSQALAWLWDGLGPTEKVYSAALAEIADEGETIPKEEVVRVLADGAARLRTREVENAPSELVKRRVLEKTDGNEYRFAVELLRRWVREHKPLREVKDELDRIDPLAEQLFSAGQKFFHRRQWKAAIAQFRLALKENSRHFRAQLHLGKALLEIGQIDDAVMALEQAYGWDRQETRSTLANALMLQAQVQEEKGNYDGALKVCERAFQIAPDEPRIQEMQVAIWVRQGDAGLGQGDLETALAVYRKAGAVEKLAKVGDAALAQSKLEIAMTAYRDAGIIEKVTRIEALQKLAALYDVGIEHLQNQSWKEAITVFRGIVLIDPGFKDVLQKLDEAKARDRKYDDLEDLYRASRIHLENEQWQPATIYLRRIVDSGEQYKDAATLLEEAIKQSKLQQLYSDAEVRLKERRWNEAIEALDEIERTDAAYRDSSARLKFARIQQRLQRLYDQAQGHLREKNWLQAIRCLEVVLKEDLGYLDAAGKLDEARRQQGLATTYSAGIGLLQTGRYEEAIGKFTEIIQQVGGSYEDVANWLANAQEQQKLVGLFDRGLEYWDHQEWGRALREFEAVVAIKPDYRDVQAKIKETQKHLRIEDLRRQGEVSFHKGNWQEAIEAFTELYELDLGNDSVRARLEEAKKQLELEKLYDEGARSLEKKRWRIANNAFKRVALIDPDYHDVKAKLESVQENLARRNIITDVLRDPVWQGIGVIVAILLAIISFIVPQFPKWINNILNPMPTPIATAVPTLESSTLCNGNSENNFACWQHGGKMNQTVKCDGNGCYAILGDPSYPSCSGVPAGEAWIKQTVQVPQGISPTLSLRYRFFSYDLYGPDGDYFEIAIGGNSVEQYGNSTQVDCTAGKPPNPEWQFREFDLSNYQEQGEVEILFRNVNADSFYNSWTYVADVKIDVH